MNTKPTARACWSVLLVVASSSLLGHASNGVTSTVKASPPGALAQPSVTGGAGKHAQARIDQSYGQLPLSFERNAGQTDARVDFLSRGKGYTLFLTEGGGATFALLKGAPEAAPSQPCGPERHEPGKAPVPPHESLPGTSGCQDPSKPARAEGSVLRLTLPGSTPDRRGTGHDPMPGKMSYLTGSDRSAWRGNVATYGRVKYEEVYPGIDLVYYGNQNQLEYDFVVRAGADPSLISLAFDGADALAIDEGGNLAITVDGQAIVQKKPVVYQDRSGQREMVEGRYEIGRDRRVAFELGAYDRTRDLVIDPILVYSTFLGGGLTWASDEGRGIAVDASGAIYVVGYTSAIDFPGTGSGFDTTSSGNEVFVTKFSADGASVVYSTYLGGSGSEYPGGIAVDAAGAAHVTGYTYSSDFPTTSGAYDTSFSYYNADLFVAKLSPDGSSLAYGTYLGGASYDYGSGIALDTAGAAYVTGYTYSSDFPTTAGAFATSNNGYQDAFVAKLSADGSSLEYGTYLGGSSDDYGQGIAVDATGVAYVTGTTHSSNFPVSLGAFDTSWANGDGFVAKLSADGASLAYATYLGGSSNEWAQGIAVDGAGAAHVSGYTYSSDFPVTTGAFDTSWSYGYDAFVAKLSADGGSLVYGTYLGGTSDDIARGVALDADGAAYVTGYTYSANFPTSPGALDTSFDGSYDAFVAKLTADGSSLAYGTYVGGTNGDYGWAIAVDGTGGARIAGWTSSADFPTSSGAFDTSWNGNGDAFVTGLNPAGSGLELGTYLGGNQAGGDDLALAIDVDGAGQAYVLGYTTTVDFPATAGAFDTSWSGSVDLFVAKLSADGSSLVYGTYLGGSHDDYGRGIAVDASGAAYVTGYTYSNDFPVTAGAFDTSLGYLDGFVAKLSPDGSGLAYATFVGGNSDDIGFGIAVDATGAAYVTGRTGSTDFPATPGAFDTTLNTAAYYYDAFVAKLSADGSSLEYGTYLGGSYYEEATGIAVDATGAAYVTGNTSSTDFPATAGAFDTSLNTDYYSQDAFVAKLSADGSSLEYGTYLGGSYWEYPRGIAVDANGAAFVTGYTYWSDFPTTPGAYDTSWNNGEDAFVVKLHEDGSSLDYATYIGGTSSDIGYGIAVDASGAAHITGHTYSSDFPTTSGAIDTSFNNGADVFYAKLSADGSSLDYGTYLGGYSSDYAQAIAVDVFGSAYIAGYTYSSTFPTTPGAADETWGPYTDAFVTKIGDHFNQPPVITSITGPTVPMAVNTGVLLTTTFDDALTFDAHTCTIAWGDSTTSGVPAPINDTTCSDTHAYTAAGVYTVVVTVTDDDGLSDTESYQYVVVYDPAAGYVTGFGTIASPAGAYTPNPTITGDATFGFVSRYQPGAQTPTGKTEFKFQAAGFRFYSASYEWLVVSGKKAQYKGTGTINGTGSYKFILTASDEVTQVQSGADRFRIKIWDSASGGIVYDNKHGEPDDLSSDTQAITSGAISVHR